MPAARYASFLMAAWAMIVPAWGQDATDPPTDRPAEEDRLDSRVFHDGLRARGLVDFLELHLAEFPPTAMAASLRMKRDLKLAVYADRTLPIDQRRAALAEANRLLAQLLAELGDEPERFELRFQLAHSLLYDEAEPLFVSYLYRGGGRQEGEQLTPITERTVDAITTLVDELTEEYDRIDGLSIRQYERIENTGYIDLIDRLEPQARYLRLWAWFYDALPRTDADPRRAAELNAIVNELTADPTLLNTRHERSKVRVQALLLAGMTYRLLNNHLAAREHLRLSIDVADAIKDTNERTRIAWAVTLAWIEHARNDAEAGKFDAALRTLTAFRSRKLPPGQDAFGITLVADLAERFVFRARARKAKLDQRLAEEKKYIEESWQPLAHLVRNHADRRNEVFVTLHGLIDPDTPPSKLDAFEQCAMVAGLVFEAGEPDADASALLDRAVEVGSYFLAHASGAGTNLRPDVLYNTAIAQYRQSRTAEAAALFLEVARDYPFHDDAAQAAAYAAQLSSHLYKDPKFAEHPQVVQLYKDSLRAVVTNFADTDAGKYWRFYYAQLLEKLGEYEEAAKQYALVSTQHEHAESAPLFHVRAMARGMTQLCHCDDPDLLSIRSRMDDFVDAHRAVVTKLTAWIKEDAPPEKTARFRTMLAEARVLAAEVQILPHINRHAMALADLEDFESTCGDIPGLIGRVWRVRLVSYEQLGRIDEAAEAIPAYMAAAPTGAADTLQSLYTMLAREADRLTAAGNEEAGQRKADVAMLLAEQIMAQADDDAPRYALTLQLAEAYNRSSKWGKARPLLESLMKGDMTAPDDQAPEDDQRLLTAYAEALFQLREYAEALPRFNRLVTNLPPRDQARFAALLRDLQCRTQLGHDAAGIIKVIDQQKYLYPDLGGPHLAEQFEILKRNNERRLSR